MRYIIAMAPSNGFRLPNPGGPVSLNPQPLPPGGAVSLNPQPLPPRYLFGSVVFQ